MTNTTRVRWLAWGMAVLLAGCASGVKLDDGAPVETRTPTDAAAAGAAAAGAGSTGAAQSQVTSVDLTKPGSGAADSQTRVIYFDFDSYVVKDEYRPTIDAYAKALSADRKKRVVLEGHTDEAGGREYNLALGQKRAEAVQKALLLLGAQSTQIESVSFGEERPAGPGSDDAAKAKNRRVEIVYR